ncbi:DNA-binding protein [Mycolicibacterium sarraceniae]|uniref:DNA-binding protein n=2 Tax=Mycolicibacterium sarraceniae TaxID=1534348 RepID=A0A7I7SMH7_9MYCO|nr:DNA-binding protein [Mycolicibacterium sarraceniae]
MPLGAWLADMPDDRLIRLLELRPDLAQPAPGSIAALAARAVARQSVKAATDELDFLRLAILDALLVLHAETTAVPVAGVVALIGKRCDKQTVLAALDDLRDRALVWGDDAGVRVSAETAAGLPWYPGQAILEDSSKSAAEISAAIDALSEPQTELLELLLTGSPVGRTRDAAPDAPADRPVPQLLAAGLLRQLDEETVILPRQVGQVLRGEEPGPADLSAPDPVTSSTTVADADAAAAGALLDVIREIEMVIETLSTTTVPELRSGGLGVREAKRLSKLTGIDEQRLGLVLEISAAAGLIASGTPDPQPADGPGPYWTPTVAADRFLETPTAARWYLLATTWLELPSRPGLIGSRGPDGKPYAALSDSLYSTAAPLDRLLLLELLAALVPGSGVDAMCASQALIWQRPRWAARLQPEPVAHLLDEAHTLGLVGRGALSTPARVLLTGDEDAAVEAMNKILPAPIDHFLVQADLTVVAPGPLQRELADELASVAAVESAGAAMVYRVSEASIRHALDTGRSAGSLHAFFEGHSKTPVPQGLTYLINDVARRHGQLRVGIASSFLRCEDPSLLAHAVAAQALEHLEVRLLAPTVAVSQAPIGELLAALRAAGFAPAAEDSSGAIVDLRTHSARVSAPGHRRLFRPMPKPSVETLASVVAVLRRVDSANPFANVRLDPAVSMALLQQAAMEHKDVVIGYVDAAGVATQRVVRPLTVSGGQLLAWDPTQGRPREFAVHRVTSVMSAGTG